MTPPTSATSRVRDVLRCPRCWGAVGVLDDAVTCDTCGATYRREGDLFGLVAPELAAGAETTFYNDDDEQRFGRDAEAIDPNSRRWVTEYLAGLAPQALVLEIGAGAGAFRGAHPGLVHLDLSWGSLAAYEGGVRLQGDAQALPLADASVDAVFSVFAIEHLPEPERALIEVDRVLRPGGRALLYPAWLVRPWASNPLWWRATGELHGADRVRRALLELRNTKPYQLLRLLPGRVAREAALAAGRRDLPFAFRRLEPNLTEYLGPDSDAAVSMDPEAMSAWFVSRGYRDHRRAGVVRRLTYGYEPIDLTKGQ